MNKKQIVQDILDTSQANLFADSDDFWVSDEVLGELFGVHSRTIGKYCEDGVLSRRRGLFPLLSSVHHLVVHLRGVAARGTEGTISDERRRLLRIKGDQAELALARERGGLVSAERVKETWAEHIANARARLLSLPTKAAGLLQGKRNPAEIEALLRDLVYEALTELAAGKTGDSQDQDPEAETIADQDG